MVEIKENQELIVDNVFCFKGKVRQEEIENLGKEMECYIKGAGAIRVGNPITATYAIEDGVVDVEMLIPIDKEVVSIDKFFFTNQVRIVNAVVASYKGHPVGLQEAYERLNQHIKEHNLRPVTVGYNVTRKVDILSPENTEVEVYVGIALKNNL